MKGDEETVNSEEMRDEAVIPGETKDVRAPGTVGETDAQVETEVPAGKGVLEIETTGAETGEENDSEDSGKSQEEPGRRGFFGKKKDKGGPRDIQIEELTGQVRRIMTEFGNYRKWIEKEKSAMYEIEAKDIVGKMLPVVDNFERGLAAIPEDIEGSPSTGGMEVIYKRLLKALEEAGVKPTKAVGQEFDPNFHNAVMHIEDENLGKSIVTQELQKSYMYRDSVVRHSIVQVANWLETGNWKLANIRK